jgi:hypothetical protein
MDSGKIQETGSLSPERPVPLLVFADDWGRHPSSCQQLARHWLTRHSVEWVDTIGTRPPRLDRQTVVRGLEKLNQWRCPSALADAPTPDRLRVHQPRMWPWFRSGFDRSLNRRLLLRQLRPVIDRLPTPPAIVTTIPVVADLIGGLPASRWIYYCVDDFGQWPGLDGEHLSRMERDLVQKAHVLIAVSETLRDRLAAMGRDSHLLTHGVDVELWRSGGGPPCRVLEGLPRPILLFWGVIDRRLDVSFLERLSSDLEAGTIALVGPEQSPDPRLGKLGRIVRLPPVSLQELPHLAREAAVLIMPYADLPVTRAMQPLKLKEYLATDRPVVVRSLPATRPWSDCLDLADSPASFSEVVRARLRSGPSGPQRTARARLEEERWASKAHLFERWAFGPQDSLVVPARPICCPREA